MARLKDLQAAARIAELEEQLAVLQDEHEATTHRLAQLMTRPQPRGDVLVQTTSGTFLGHCEWTPDDGWLVLREPFAWASPDDDPQPLAGPLWVSVAQVVTVQPRPVEARAS